MHKIHSSRDFFNVLSFTARRCLEQPTRLAMVTISMLVATLAEVLGPVFSGRLVDTIAQGTAAQAPVWNSAIHSFLVLIALAIVALLMRQIAFVGISNLTLTMTSDITASAFYRVQRFSTDWHANSFAGSTVRKITRGTGALAVLNDAMLLSLLPTLVMVIGSGILLGWSWPGMALIFACSFLVYASVTVALSLRFVAPAANLANNWDTRLGGSLADAISCNAVVKGFGGEAREDERLMKVVAKWRRRVGRTWERSNYAAAVRDLSLLALWLCVVGYTLLLWSRGLASPGDVAFVLASVAAMRGYLRDLGLHVRNVQRSANEMLDLVEIHDQPLSVADRPGAAPIRIKKGNIEFEKVHFCYEGNLPLFRGLSTSIEAGERVGLVGRSGSGKTTFARLIQRLYDVSGGRILVDGQDVSKVTQTSLRSQIAIVQQDPALFHRSLAENIAYSCPGATPAAIEQAARLASAHEFIVRLPKGYGTLVGERGVKLSGGERQRVAIARAFLANAPILILDEATSSLDSESEVLIQQAMERLMVGRTTLVIAHRLSTVCSLDRLLVFDRGRIVEEGDHAALVMKGGIYSRLFERQALGLSKRLV
ncbi:ABC transporter ATP-binding protein [Mesorhizobium carmichaelinearum]|uniref:ABC transporter ATP-binding protein n=1 Tax=Mesorhizobium carmichaelinearum TaxID=1208188 RepID=UPI000BA39421|nr:ABC transporter ATP-binding protein [Mesorhizobium carmichaelinearum]